MQSDGCQRTDPGFAEAIHSPSSSSSSKQMDRHLGSWSGTRAQKRRLFTWRKRAPADTFGRMAGSRRKGAEWVPCWMWEVCLDCDLAGVLTPPRLLSSSVFPRGSCAPSVVHGGAVKMLLPHLFSSLPSFPPPPFLYSIFLYSPPPDSPMFLFTSPRYLRCYCAWCLSTYDSRRRSVHA